MRPAKPRSQVTHNFSKQLLQLETLFVAIDVHVDAISRNILEVVSDWTLAEDSGNCPYYVSDDVVRCTGETMKYLGIRMFIKAEPE